jgi:DNA-binding LytR/AlgR family response regulator
MQKSAIQAGLASIFPADVRGRNRLYGPVSAGRFHTLCVDFVHLPEKGLQAFGENPIFAYHRSETMEVLVISKGTEMLCVPVDRLVYISSDGNYSTVVTQDNRKQIVSYQLGQIEDLIDEQLGDDGSRFTRLGRCLIVNVDFVYFVDISKQRLILSDCLNFYEELTASREVLIKLKAYKEALRKYGKP